MPSVSGRFLDFWYPELPKYTENPNQGWVDITLMKRDNTGEFIEKDGIPVKFHRHLETSTGDLYGVIDGDDIDPPRKIALKAIGIGIGAIPYAAIVMGLNACRIVIDLSAIFWRVIPQFIQHISTKGLLAALGTVYMEITWEIPSQVIADLWAIALSATYAFDMMRAALFTIISPLEGRKWLARIEYNWHDCTSYKHDLRYRAGKDLGFFRAIKELIRGKILYLGYCMQVRGNMRDSAAGKRRFEVWKQPEAPKKSRPIAIPISKVEKLKNTLNKIDMKYQVMRIAAVILGFAAINYFASYKLSEIGSKQM